MLDSILKRKDVQKLLKEVCCSDCYNTKETKISLEYENYYNKEKPFFIIIDALYKYKVIINDDDYLDEYIFSLEKLMRKIDNYSDIERGINKLIVRICSRKLALKNITDIENKKELLSYIYKNYIVEGYMFHSIPNIYKQDIIENGLNPEHYNNLYQKFIHIKKILKKHKAETIIEKKFNEHYITMTDSLIKAYYYAENAPMYFSSLLSNSNIMTNKKYKKDAYYRKDYKDCFYNLNRLSTELNLTIKESNYLKKVCKEEWELLKNNKNIPTVLLVKRKYLGNNYLKDIDNIMSLINKNSLDDIVRKIITSRFDNIEIKTKIKSTDIEVIELYSYKDIYERENNNVEEDIKIKENIFETSTQNLTNAYGKVSILLLLGSLLITIGVIISIIMLEKGM